MDVKTKAVDKAVKYLQAASARFHIVTEDGTHYGEPINQKPLKTREYRGPSNAALARKTLADMQPGDSKRVSAQEGDTARRLASNLQAAAHHKWGAGATVCAITSDDQVEILRIQ